MRAAGSPAGAAPGVWIVAAASLLGALAIFVVGPVLTYALAVTAGVTTGVGLGIASHLRKHGAVTATLGCRRRRPAVLGWQKPCSTIDPGSGLILKFC